MPIPITVPRLGWSMEEGTFAEWLKRDGDWVRIGEMLFVLEAEKGAQEIESFDEGTLSIPADAPQPGDTVKVGQVIGHLLTPSEAPAPAAELVQSPTSRQKPASTPRARRAARELGVDWHTVAGTGRAGRIRERDVLTARLSPLSPALRGRSRSEDPSPPTPLPSKQGRGEKETLTHSRVPSSVRRTIAERMLHSCQATAPVTLTTSVDATNLVNLRQQFKVTATTAGAIAPTYTDLFVKLAAAALQADPTLNVRCENDQITTLSEINISIAVDTDAGLLAPVIRNVPGLTLRELALQVRQLSEKARSGKLTLQEMNGGTFTVTNLGAYGIDAFTPIINWPECAILGVGRIQKQAVVVDDQVVPRDMVTLSLTFDHRLVDGAPAARFLQRLSTAVQNPAAWLIE